MFTIKEAGQTMKKHVLLCTSFFLLLLETAPGLETAEFQRVLCDDRCLAYERAVDDVNENNLQAADIELGGDGDRDIGFGGDPSKRVRWALHPSGKTRPWKIHMIGSVQQSSGKEMSLDENHVVLTEAKDQGQDCFKIETVFEGVKTTYYYDKAGAGFTSLVDADGQDWISFRPTGGSAGNYRGIPNLCDEFGHSGAEGATSTTDAPTGIRLPSATITSEKGRWETVWHFFPTHAEMILVQSEKNYWILYEGTPGGKIGEDDSVRLCDGRHFSCYDFDRKRRLDDILRNTSGVAEGSEWAVFSDGKSDRSLIYLHTADRFPEEYWQMNEEMTVFGFARTNLQRHLSPQDTPQRLVVALVETRDPDTWKRIMDRIWKNEPETEKSR